MIQTAIRALTLNIYNVSDDMVFQFVTTPPASSYFSDLVLSIKMQLLNLDNHVQVMEDGELHKRTIDEQIETDKIVDDLYYLDDVIRVGEPRLRKLIVSNLVSLIALPMLISLLQLSQSDAKFLSGVASLVAIVRLLQIVREENLVNFVASAVLFADMSSTNKNVAAQVRNGGENYATACPESKHEEGLKTNCLLEHLSGYLSSDFAFGSSKCADVLENRSGIMSHILSDNKCLMLSSIMLLLVLVESKDLDSQLAGLMGFCQTKTNLLKRSELSDSLAVDGRGFARHLPQILHALLMVLASQPPYSVSIQWQAGWFLRKLLVFQGYKLDSDDVHIFNMSYEQSCECILSELRGCWFDHIPDTLTKEWASCKRVLEESSQSKDPFFALQLSPNQHAPCGTTYCGGNASTLAWQKMVNAVKVFVLHVHLKAFIFGTDPFENPTLSLNCNSLAVSGRKYASDLCSAGFGSEVSLASAIPCRIAFSKVGIRDIYIAPVAMGISGKLLLLERHPLHSKRGLVIVMAPLAGLNPKIDEKHPTWLHLQIRELEPRFVESKTKTQKLNTPNYDHNGRWTLGFADAMACHDAHLVIVEEANKQCSFVGNLIAPLLDNKP